MIYAVWYITHCILQPCNAPAINVNPNANTHSEIDHLYADNTALID